MIRTDSDEYFIEPLERGTQDLEDGGRVHVVYRRSALLRGPSDISVDYQAQGRIRPGGSGGLTDVCTLSSDKLYSFTWLRDLESLKQWIWAFPYFYFENIKRFWAFKMPNKSRKSIQRKLSEDLASNGHVHLHQAATSAARLHSAFDSLWWLL